MFVKHGAKGKLYLLLWVDDLFFGCDDAELRANFMAAFKARFRVKDLGVLTQGLGAAIRQDLKAGTVSFDLAAYIGDVSRRFNLAHDVSWADIP